MNDTEHLQVARGLAELATQSTKQASVDFQQIASNPYLQNALIGAGAGGAIGALQPKKKLRAMLNYALMGGLGGVGVTAAKQFGAPATPPPAVARAGHDGSLLNTAVGLGSAGAGAYGGHRAHGMLDRWGKLDRLMEANPDMAKTLGPAIEKMRGRGKSTAEITEALLSKGVGKKTTGPAVRAAYNKLPHVRGRYALPVAGALAAPALISSLRGLTASE